MIKIRKYIIYIIRNTDNDKVYIGQTYQELSKRWKQHKYYSASSNEKIYRAMRKYGFNSFSIEFFCQLETVEESDLKEKELILINNSISNGYNTQSGGRSGFEMTEDVKRRISESNKGKVVSSETRLKMSRANLGKKLSEEHKRKCSESQLGEKSAWWGRKHTEITKEKIREGNLNKVVSKETSSKISISKKGSKWSDETRENMKKRKTKPTKKVINVTSGVVYPSLKEAGIVEKISSKEIGAVCRGKRKSTHGMIYKYIN